MTFPTQQLLQEIKRLGFELVGITLAKPPECFDAFERWLDAGLHAGMQHFVRNFNARKHPNALLPGVQSIMMLGVSYATVLNSEPHPIKHLSGIVEYARGVDYHLWIRSRLNELAGKHRELFPESRSRIVIDTAPFFEKHYAAAAGLGSIGKNTLLIHPKLGSKFFLGALLSTELLDISSNAATRCGFDPCKNCRQCLDACPTGALTEPYVLDARRCLSYWTLIHRGPLPKDIEEKRGNRFLGFDLCQRVCPHNREIAEVLGGEIDPFSLDSETLRTILVGTPLRLIES